MNDVVPRNLASDIPATLPQELTQTLLASDSVRIERIVSRGHTSSAGSWYDQNENEWVLVVAGAARIRFEKELVELNPGDYVHIPAHCKHRVEWTSPDEATVWLAVFYLPE